MHETNQFITTKHKSFYNNLNKPLINSHPSIIMRPPTKPAGKDDVAPRKANSPVVKCPRCDSPNTKFCYYNNYSLTQPRHFCKTCRRYWTKGGAMRSVPIGGGSRKNKKMKTSSDVPDDPIGGSSSDIGGVKFFQGIAPAMDFQLGGITPPFPRIPNTALFNFSGSGNLSSTLSATSANPFAFDPSAANFTPGFNFPFSPAMKLGNNFPGSSNLASSIESLSSINQDLHWKLQKQRLSMLLGDAVQKPGGTVQKPQPILFKSLDFSKTDIKGLTKDGGIGNVSTEWFFDNEYGNMSQITPATSGGDVEESSGGGGGGWGGIDQGWSDHDLSGYASLP